MEHKAAILRKTAASEPTDKRIEKSNGKMKNHMRYSDLQSCHTDLDRAFQGRRIHGIALVCISGTERYSD